LDSSLSVDRFTGSIGLSNATDLGRKKSISDQWASQRFNWQWRQNLCQKRRQDVSKNHFEPFDSGICLLAFTAAEALIVTQLRRAKTVVIRKTFS
jgi:hypothetical protein